MNLKLNYERLKRHYESNLKNYDEISLLDLSHSLRMWIDMKDEVNEYICNLNKQPKFKSYTISKQFSRFLKNKKYIITSVPEGVKTWAGNEEMISSELINIGTPMTSSVLFMKDNDSCLNFKEIILIIGYETPPEERNIFKKGLPIKSYNFEQWLNAEVARVSFTNDENKVIKSIIPRNKLITRTANILGGSHPISNFESENIFNKPVKHLMKVNFGGLPSPYFLLMKIAKDIIQNIEIK